MKRKKPCTLTSQCSFGRSLHTFKKTKMLYYLLLLLLLLFVAGVYGQSHDYGRALSLSQKFYVAQRCGDLPDNNRVTWRRDSFLDDGGDRGIDLTGGYFDAGDHVKFGFPMAYSITVMAWGMVQYGEAFKRIGEWEYGLENLKWGTDYLLKAHISDNEIIATVGNGTEDHWFWGRPEEYPNKLRPSFKIDAEHPGSELAGETAAAMAATSIVIRESDPAYADLLVEHAKTLYNFADTYRGFYDDALPEGVIFYGSWSYDDELVWGAMWLYKATGDETYLNNAARKWDEFYFQWQDSPLNWESKRGGATALLYEATGEQKYADKLTEYVNFYLNEAQRTPGGMLYFSLWGSCRNAANAALQLLIADDLGLGQNGAAAALAKEQIDYILGSNPLDQSYVIGYGSKYPLKPHHRSSSCKLKEDCEDCACGWTDFESPDPNPQLLEGALVGGPDENDQWVDRRDDAAMNEVATDYNAGFQSALAGIITRTFTH